MMDKRSKMVDKDKYVWECIVCGRKVINKEKPELCICGQPNYVVNIQYIITK